MHVIANDPGRRRQTKDFDGKLWLVLVMTGLFFCNSVSTNTAHQLHCAVAFSFSHCRLCQLLFLEKGFYYFAVLDLGSFLTYDDMY